MAANCPGLDPGSEGKANLRSNTGFRDSGFGVRFFSPDSCLLTSGVDVLSRYYGQATKGVRWMPWRQTAKKDVVTCDKPRLGGNTL